MPTRTPVTVLLFRCGALLRISASVALLVYGFVALRPVHDPDSMWAVFREVFITTLGGVDAPAAYTLRKAVHAMAFPGLAITLGIGELLFLAARRRTSLLVLLALEVSIGIINGGRPVWPLTGILLTWAMPTAYFQSCRSQPSPSGQSSGRPSDYRTPPEA